MVEGAVVVAYDDTSGERVFVRFVGVNSTLFGAPNDEALDSHPLYERGLTFYAFAEVEESPWVSDLERANRVHASHSPESFSGLRHFILPFHDSTFECVARTVEVLAPDTDDRLAAAAR